MAEPLNPFNKALLSEAELASSLGLSPWTVRRLRLNEGLPVIAIAGRYFYRHESVLRWFEERETSGVNGSLA